MTPDNSPVKKLFANCPSIHLMYDRGNSYAGYIRCEGIDSVVLEIPSGNYMVEWMDPVTGVVLKTEERFHENGGLLLGAPDPACMELSFKVIRKRVTLFE
jgi:hypothetical protein